MKTFWKTAFNIDLCNRNVTCFIGLYVLAYDYNLGAGNSRFLLSGRYTREQQSTVLLAFVIPPIVCVVAGRYTYKIYPCVFYRCFWFPEVASDVLGRQMLFLSYS